MSTIEAIKSGIKHLYENSPNIHVSIKMTRPKVIVESVPAVITGIYPNIFCIEERNSGYLKKHYHQYVDVLTGQVEILELSK